MNNPTVPIIRDIGGVMYQQEGGIPVLQGIGMVLGQSVHLLIVMATGDENNISV
ncbi:MAG: hypothetical protein NTV68_09850 [Methanomicrobiales archaeon]|nr:hypothetical protein [Methanomicrobiales archaeon]